MAVRQQGEMLAVEVFELADRGQFSYFYFNVERPLRVFAVSAATGIMFVFPKLHAGVINKIERVWHCAGL